MVRLLIASLLGIALSIGCAQGVQAAERDPSWRAEGDQRACSAPRWSADLAPVGPGAGRRVVVIGDSLTRESQGSLHKLLRKSGWNPTIRCFGGKRLDWALDQIRDQKSWRGMPDHVVIAMGTNDMRWIDRSVTEARIRAVIKALGPNRKVIWINTFGGNGDRFSKEKQRWFNTTLERIVSKRANVSVLPWDSIATRADVDLVDPLHYSRSGYLLRSRETVALLNSLGS